MSTRLRLDKALLTNRDIRQRNRLLILHELLVRGTSTRQELSQATGLSTATVANLVVGLLQEKLVQEVGIESGPVGRPTTTLAINASAGSCVGVDVAETYIHFELFDLALNLVGAHEIELPHGAKRPEEVVALIKAGFDDLVARFEVTRKAVVGIGVSIPGPFEHATGVSVFAPTWGWRNVPLQGMLEQLFGVPVYMDNPLKFNALAEVWFGAGRDIDTLAAVVLGTGVGAGLVINGQLFNGASNTAGEWGHSTIVVGGRPCRCGNLGCLEAYVGAPGIAQTLAEQAPDSPLLHRDDEARTVAAIAGAAQQSDPTALAVVKRTALYLSAGLTSLVNTLNPNRVILGSWVTRELGAHLLEETLSVMQRQALALPLRAVQVVLSDMQRNPVSLGAATLVLEEYLAKKVHRPGPERRRPAQTDGAVRQSHSRASAPIKRR